MTKTTPATPDATPRLEQLNPAALTVAANVRMDLRLDDHFVKSIKVNGIIQPVVAYPDPDQPGTYRILAGHRRTAAAVKLNLTSIPVVIVNPPDDTNRVVEQLVENLHRDDLTVTETANAYQQLALDFALPAIQIAKRTATSLDSVGHALTVAKSPGAAKVLEQMPELTLDVLAHISVFDDDDAAVRKLTTTARTDPAKLPHVLADLQRTRDMQTIADQQAAEHEAAGITVIRGASSFMTIDGYVRGSAYRLAGTDRGTRIDLYQPLEDLAKLPGMAMNIGIEYGNVYRALLIADTHLNHYTELWAWGDEDEAEDTTEAAARAAAAEQARHEREARAAAREAAAEVRHAWLKTLLDRPKLPEDHTQLIITLLMSGLWLAPTAMEADLDLAPLLLLTEPVPPQIDEEANPNRDAITALAAKAPVRRPSILLALVLAAAERELANPWSDSIDGPVRVIYFSTLQSWGYGLSDYEQSLIQPADDEAGEADE